MNMNYLEEIKKLEELDKKYIWHPFTQMKDWLEEKPIIITEGRDCFIKDIHGKWYIDGVSSIWVNIHGHRKKEIDDAIKKQLDKIAHSTLLGLANIPSIKLAEKLIQIAPKPLAFKSRHFALTKVFYSDNGSTAVEVALKMAFQYWIHKGVKNKHSFLSLKNAYHGDTIGAMSVGGIDIFHKTFEPLFFKTFKAPSPYCYRCELEKTPSECSFECLTEMEDILEKHSDKIAAVIVEPIVQAAGGMIVWPEGYLKRVRELCNKHNVLLIADEIATGFGRTGKMFACEHEDVVPDIMCLSKGITNGYMPLAATLSTDEIYDTFLGEFKDLKTFFHGHSYTGNPLACAAAIASIDLFEKEGTLKSMQPKIALLEKKLKEIADLPNVGNVRNKGLIAGIELVRDKFSKEPYPWEEKIGWKVAYKAREDGVLIRPLGNIIVVMPPLAISVENLNRLMNVIKKAILSVTNN
ncbi:adenosylmethionine--8-amino-7-oxononanoate transaminase [hot springs metagenome]|uniref:Adenosylmethionine--8-amino-7-oxononanoate transaminase n=1 Tax=hot springs metagenome TaxID=433727 RepID=A0A5J4L5N5_9ZZZZ